MGGLSDSLEAARISKRIHKQYVFWCYKIRLFTSDLYPDYVIRTVPINQQFVVEWTRLF